MTTPTRRQRARLYRVITSMCMGLTATGLLLVGAASAGLVVGVASAFFR